jgi:hypothetical protein
MLIFSQPPTTHTVIFFQNSDFPLLQQKKYTRFCFIKEKKKGLPKIKRKDPSDADNVGDLVAKKKMDPDEMGDLIHADDHGRA